jgi:hypothetical protein
MEIEFVGFHDDCRLHRAVALLPGVNIPHRRLGFKLPGEKATTHDFSGDFSSSPAGIPAHALRFALGGAWIWQAWHR